MATMKHLEVQPTAKNVTVYRNGDLYFPGRKFVVNEKQVRNFDSFLNQVTNGLGARFGAVRNIWTPTHGHRVRELEAIDNGKTYVAGGFERFRKMDYDHIASKLQEQRSPRTKKTFSQIKPVQHSRLQRSAQYLKASQATGPVTIHIYRNGEPARRPMKLLLTKYMMRTLENVLEYVAQKVELSTGAVRSPYAAPAYQIPSIGKIVSAPSKCRRQSVRLFTMDFGMVEDLSQIQNGQYYVAVGMQRLQKLPYGDTSLNSSLGTTAAVRRRKLRPLQPGKVSENSSYVNRLLRYGPPSYAKPKETKKEENSVFHHKPAKVKRSPKSNTTSILNSEHSGSGGPFHASGQREETKDAGIVGENEDTKVELPIDQVEADEVEEEEINTGQDVEVKLSESGRQTYSKDEGQRSSPHDKPEEIVEESPSGERNDSRRSKPSSPPHSKPNTPPRGKSSSPPPDNSNSPPPNNRTSPSPSNRNTPPPSDRNTPPQSDRNSPPPNDRTSPPPDNNSPPPNARNSSSQSKRNSPSPSKSPTKDVPNTPTKSPSPTNPPASKPTTPERVNTPEKAASPVRDPTPPAVEQEEVNNKVGGPEANKTEEQLAEEGA
ncbi:doublecortin domain-containing protein 2-like isoform X2 [Branchiostoma floridae x Branchiostoma japonicum]